MNVNDDEKISRIWDEIEEKCGRLKILMGGKTGVGKSSIINSLVESEISKVSDDGRPCTKKNEEIIWSTDVGEMAIIDVPGFGEANSPKIDSLDYQENIRCLATDAHLMLMVLKCDDKALELEEKFLTIWQSDPSLKKIPLIIVVNQIDKAKPVREWNPNNFNLSNPTSPKEIYIKSYLDYVSSLPVFSLYSYGKSIFPVSAGETIKDEKYGFDVLRNAINSHIPEVLSLIIDRHSKSKEEKGRAILKYYSTGAGAAALQPIPGMDSFFIAPFQVGMIIHLGKLHNVHITKSVAGALLGSIGLNVIGTHLFMAVVSLVPGVKQVVQPVIAYSLTYTTGLVVNDLFSTGKLNPSEEDIKGLVKKYKDETKKAKKDYENNI
jgi:small GTP-binding protein